MFNEIRPDPRFEDDLTLSVDSILQRHWKPDMGALLENVALDGSPMLDLPEGRMFHPGHAIESAWMLMEIARQRGDETPAADGDRHRAGRRWITAGTDEYGGLRYITNVDWTPTHSLEADLKLWWPHGETLYALLLAWDLTGRERPGRVVRKGARLHLFALPRSRVRRVVRLSQPRRIPRVDGQGQRLERFLPPAPRLVPVLPVASVAVQ